MKKAKKILIITCCIVIAAGGTVSGFEIRKSYKYDHTVIPVVPVSLLSSQGYFDNSQTELDATVTQGNLQSIQKDDEKLIKKIYVKKGSKVKKGDPLVEYDTEKLKIDVELCKVEIAKDDDDIKSAEKKLAQYKKLKPSSSALSKTSSVSGKTANADNVEDIYDITDDDTSDETEETSESPSETESSDTEDDYDSDYIENISQASSGSGTSSDPYVFDCSQDTVISSGFLSQIKSDGLNARFDVSDGDSFLYSLILSGDGVLDASSDFSISSLVTVGSDGSLTIGYSVSIRAKITTKQVASSTSTDDEGNDDSDLDDEEIDDNYGDDYFGAYGGDSGDSYTAADLKQMISEQESKIKDLKIKKQQSQVDLKQKENALSDGKVRAEFDGVVISVNKKESSSSDSDSSTSDITNSENALIQLQGSAGTEISVQICEADLNKIKIGDTVSVTNWDTGDVYDAKIVKISDEPVSYTNYTMSTANPNNSTYTFIADIKSGKSSISSDMGFSVTIDADSTNTDMYIPAHYVKDKNGASYVYKKGKKGKLEKVEIVTGKSVSDGSNNYYQIISGISEDDYLAFPYSKNIKSGLKTKDSEDVLMNGTDMQEG